VSRLSTPKAPSLPRQPSTSRNHANNPASSLSLSEINRPCLNNRPLAQTHLGPMASTGKSSSLSGSAAQRKVRARRARLPMVRFGEFSAPRALQSGTAFETLPPLAISLKSFQFLKSLGLKSIGLGLASVPFHFGWELVEWKPKLGVS